MPSKKEEWILGKEAVALLTAKSGHEVKQPYLRYLAYTAGKIQHRPRDGRTEEYLRSDVEKCDPVRVRTERQPRAKRPGALGRKPRVLVQ